MADFDTLIQTALAQQLTGWDFSWLNARTHEEPLPWHYPALARERMVGVQSLLDVDTGGGEMLASFAPLPPVTCATEGYPPNIILARQRLGPLGVTVADVSACGWKNWPFADGAFQLVINRHGGIYAPETARVMQPGGRFLTQQVGGQNCIEMNHFLDETIQYQFQDYTLQGAVRELETAGLRVTHAQEAFPRWTFLDIAGVVFYLNAVPWQMPGFSVERYRNRLRQLHEIIEKEGGWTVHQHRLLIEAAKSA